MLRADREVWMSVLARTARRGLLASLVMVVAACGAGDTAQAQNPQQAQQRVQQELGNVPTVVDTATATRLSATFRAAAARALPAVVFIRVREEVAQNPHANIPGLPPGFFQFPAPQQPRIGEAAGSGFIFDPRGYIMTNNHVVEHATEVTVQTADGRVYNAKVIGRDPDTDIAVIKITPNDGHPLPTVQLGNSDNAQVGDWVLALGNPLELQFTVTAGIVSAKGRQIGILAQKQGQQGQPTSTIESYIQTDAAINPGNSGGPLVDLLGRVIGVNAAIESPTGVFSGVGFAIPINLAAKVARDLMKYGVVHRPRLGVSITPVSAADAEVYGLPEVQGAVIKSVQTGTPAAKAGLQVGDVVWAVNGKLVTTSSGLTARLAEYQPGDQVTLTIYRDKRKTDVTVKLGEFQTETPKATGQPSRPAAEQVLGFSVAPLTSDIAQQLGIKQTSGVVITSVGPLSPATGAGVRRGQVIEAIDGKPVRTVQDVERVASTVKPGQVVSLKLLDPQIGETVANYRTNQ